MSQTEQHIITLAAWAHAIACMPYAIVIWWTLNIACTAAMSGYSNISIVHIIMHRTLGSEVSFSFVIHTMEVAVMIPGCNYCYYSIQPFVWPVSHS